MEAIVDEIRLLFSQIFNKIIPIFQASFHILHTKTHGTNSAKMSMSMSMSAQRDELPFSAPYFVALLCIEYSKRFPFFLSCNDPKNNTINLRATEIQLCASEQQTISCCSVKLRNGLNREKNKKDNTSKPWRTYRSTNGS